MFYIFWGGGGWGGNNAYEAHLLDVRRARYVSVGAFILGYNGVLSCSWRPMFNDLLGL